VHAFNIGDNAVHMIGEVKDLGVTLNNIGYDLHNT
jgi:hypothetical protein